VELSSPVPTVTLAKKTDEERGTYDPISPSNRGSIFKEEVRLMSESSTMALSLVGASEGTREGALVRVIVGRVEGGLVEVGLVEGERVRYGVRVLVEEEEVVVFLKRYMLSRKHLRLSESMLK
jgi:hypothetical protein